MGYYLSLPFIYGFSILPWWLLYRCSDFFFVVLFYLVRYRRKVVRRNLAHAFPEMPPRELARLEYKFYRHFLDVVFETLKNFTLSREGAVKRVTIRPESIALSAKLKAEGKDAVAILGHIGNWELCGAGWPWHVAGMRLAVLFSPLKNKKFNDLLFNGRSRFGYSMINARKTAEELPTFLGKGYYFCFIGDQAARPETAYWTTFMGQDTGVFRGAERYARKYDLPVYYVSIRKTGRGRYESWLTLVTDTPRAEPPDSITERFTQMLEANIREQPHIWLWTHKRWKHRKPEQPAGPSYDD